MTQPSAPEELAPDGLAPDGLAPDGLGALRAELAEAARVLSQLGLVTAFGHVSARSGSSMLITPATDLASVTPASMVPVFLDTSVLPAGAPAEAWAHLALYRARPDASAIARAMPPSAFAAAATGQALVPLHGQAAWLGKSVPVHDSAHLLRTTDLAARAAADLTAGEALLLRGNGALTLGTSPGLAVARMWLLSAACDTSLAARAAVAGQGTSRPTPLSAEEIASWRAVAAELLPRLWQHLRGRPAGLAAGPAAPRTPAAPRGSAVDPGSTTGPGSPAGPAPGRPDHRHHPPAGTGEEHRT